MGEYTSSKLTVVQRVFVSDGVALCSSNRAKNKEILRFRTVYSRDLLINILDLKKIPFHASFIAHQTQLQTGPSTGSQLRNVYDRNELQSMKYFKFARDTTVLANVPGAPTDAVIFDDATM